MAPANSVRAGGVLASLLLVCILHDAAATSVLILGGGTFFFFCIHPHGQGFRFVPRYAAGRPLAIQSTFFHHTGTCHRVQDAVGFVFNSSSILSLTSRGLTQTRLQAGVKPRLVHQIV